MGKLTGLERLWALIEECQHHSERNGELYGQSYYELIRDLTECYEEITEDQARLVQDKTDCEMKYERLTQGGLPTGSDRQPDSRSPVQD